jgi:hypothetical protein
MAGLRASVQLPVHSLRVRPTMCGMLGPYTSASSTPTVAPLSANARARFTVTVDLPTPPLPLPTATAKRAGGRRGAEPSSGRCRCGLVMPYYRSFPSRELPSVRCGDGACVPDVRVHCRQECQRRCAGGEHEHGGGSAAGAADCDPRGKRGASQSLCLQLRSSRRASVATFMPCRFPAARSGANVVIMSSLRRRGGRALGSRGSASY